VIRGHGGGPADSRLAASEAEGVGDARRNAYVITSEGIDARRGGVETRPMTTTSLTRPDVSQGCLDQYEALATLIEDLPEAEWNASSRCGTWQARDVAGHVVGLIEDTAAGVPGSRNADEEAASVRHESAAGAAARLRAATATLQALLDAIDDDAWAGPSGVPDLSLGDGVLTLWYDTYVHTDDIRAALGRESERGAGLDATVAYLAGQLTNRGWGPATLVLDGAGRHEIGGGGREITGDALQFAMVATGRADASTLGLDPDVNIYAA
jgi:uncharacterized protein (TIGR03083 family)